MDSNIPPVVTLTAFTLAECQSVRRLLASKVEAISVEPLRLSHWCEIYSKAKGMSAGGWSNVSTDVIHGHLSVEPRMLCYRSDQSILSACGTRQMHPAGTRAIRIPAESDATKAAQEVLRQYAEIINQRTEVVRTLDRFHHGEIDREAAISALIAIYPTMKRPTAAKSIPAIPLPVTTKYAARDPDMRTGWLLWQESLREFLYFEERTTSPNPADYYAVWMDSGGGRRKASRNLWVYHKTTRLKCFSITTEAGAKIQPYFTVPVSDDPNLYHFTVQGEVVDGGLVRVWLTQTTAAFLRHLLGGLETPQLCAAIEKASAVVSVAETPSEAFGETAIPVLLTPAAYASLHSNFQGVSDEHLIQQVIRALQESKG